MSPRVVKEKGYTIVVFSSDHLPPHVHAIKGGKIAKFTLSPVALYENKDFTEKMIREAIDIIRSHKGHCWKIWHDTHGK